MPGEPRTAEGRLPSRRAVLTLTYAAGLATLAGCGVRLDLPQPAPATPTRRKVPDEDLLVDVVRRLRRLTEDAAPLARSRAGGSVLQRVAAVTADQLRILRGRLTNGGVPTAVIEAASPAAPATRSPAALAARLAQLPADHWPAVAGAAADTRGLLTAAASAQLAGAVLLGRPLPMPSQASPARAALVERTAPLRYGFEVVAAQSRGPGRDRAVRSLASVAALARELGPGSASAPGWSLPFPVRTPDAAARLAQHLCASAIASAVAAAGLAPSGPALAEAAAWSARLQALATGWGVPLTPFPGATPGAAP